MKFIANQIASKVTIMMKQQSANVEDRGSNPSAAQASCSLMFPLKVTKCFKKLRSE